MRNGLGDPQCVLQLLLYCCCFTAAALLLLYCCFTAAFIENHQEAAEKRW
jgi:hypothetical protein